MILIRLWIMLFASVAQTTAAPVAKGYVGLSVRRNDPNTPPTVAYVAAKGPADEAGVRAEDAIVSVDGSPTLAMSASAVKDTVDGPAGTTVQLTFRRANGPDLQVTITRRPLLDVYTPAAEAGDAKAAYRIGWFYEQGPAASHDLTKAAGWYRRAAEGGDALAQTRLGDYCSEGWGEPKDLQAAAHWYDVAAHQGNAEAQRQLAYCYLRGNGLPRSDEDAFCWNQ